MYIKQIVIFSCLIFYYNKPLESDYWFPFTCIEDLQQKYTDISYHECFGLVQCDVKPFELISELASRIVFWECFILTVPNAQVQSPCGFVLKDQAYIMDLIWGGQLCLLDSLAQLSEDQIKKVSGRVAVIANMGFQSYSHWLDEVLGRLALLEMHNVEYDWLFVPLRTKSFMQETLQLWGVDPEKIIAVDDYLAGVQADELIVPSYVIDTVNGVFDHIGLYVHPYTAYYVRDKLLQAVYSKNIQCNFSKRIFVSRKDAPGRYIINEDEIFEYLQQFGFERYELSKLSVTEQIVLFNNAEIVIGAHGTGLVNCMFCQQGTKVVEIFQALMDSSFWYLSHLFQLEYIPVQTMPINKDLFLDWTNHYDEYEEIWQLDTYVSVSIIEEVVKQLAL